MMKPRPKLQASRCDVTEGRYKGQVRKTGFGTGLPYKPYTASTLAALGQVGSVKPDQQIGERLKFGTVFIPNENGYSENGTQS